MYADSRSKCITPKGDEHLSHEARHLIQYLFTPTLTTRAIHTIQSVADNLLESEILSCRWDADHHRATIGYLYPLMSGNLAVQKQGTPPLAMSPKAFGLAVTLEALNRVTDSLTVQDNPRMLADYLFDRYQELRNLARSHPAAVDIVKIVN